MPKGRNRCYKFIRELTLNFSSNNLISNSTKLIVIISFVFSTVLSCTVISSNVKAEDKTTLENKMLLGEISAEQLTTNFKAFDNTATKLTLSQNSITELSSIKQVYKITAFLGTWCHDSEREIPILLDILAAAKNPNLQLTLIAVDMNKQDPEGLAKKYQLEYTPTIIIEANGKELGRIVERPEQSLEDDILAILNQITQ